MTSTVTRNTRNSRNARSTPGIAFGAHIPARATLKCNSDRTADDDPWGSINGAPRDDGSDDNDGAGNGDPDDEPDNDGPDDPQDDPDNSEHGMENNLADAITELARKCDIKEMALARKSENPTLSMEQTQPNSEHSSFNYDLVSMIVLAHSRMIETK